jgi:hypothetical protein
MHRLLKSFQGGEYMGNYKIDPKTGLKEPNRRQKIFIEAYVRTFSLKKAAMAAGYKEYNAYHAGKVMSELPHLKPLIEERKNEYLEGIGFSRERTIAELCKQAYSDLGDFIEWNTVFDKDANRYFHHVRVKDSAEIDTSVLKSVKINKNGNLEIDLCDKQAALDKLCKILKLYGNDTLEVTGPNGGAIQIEELRSRLVDKFTNLAGQNNTGAENQDIEQSD